MIVYIEYVLLDNFIIDYMLIKASLQTLGIKATRRRLFWCASLGALFAILITFVNLPPIITFIVKFLLGLVLALLSAPRLSFKQIIIVFLVFTAYTFALGGGIIAIFSALDINYSSEISIALMFAPCYILIKGASVIIKYLLSRKNRACFITKVELSYNGKSITLNGFMDTGNNAYNGLSPVIFCPLKYIENFIDITAVKAFKYITFSTVSGEDKRLSVNLDSVKVYFGGIENIFNNVTLAIISKPFPTDYQVLLHPALLKENNEKTTTKIKKIS